MALAKEGVDVAICARRLGPLEETARAIEKETGRKIVAIPADLRKDADAKSFIEQGHKALGRVDIMVNNAGSAAGGVIEHLTEDDWEKGLQLKFMGYVRCLRYVLPLMVKQGGGRVVNLIGNDGVKPSYWEICPGAANAAGQNLTLSLAGQYGKDNISFVAVNPGPVRTERWAGLVDAMARDMKIPREEADKLAPASIPMGRIAEVDEVANLVVMLASPMMQMVNGTMIEIDGGQDKAADGQVPRQAEGLGRVLINSICPLSGVKQTCVSALQVSAFGSNSDIGSPTRSPSSANFRHLLDASAKTSARQFFHSRP